MKKNDLFLMLCFLLSSSFVFSQTEKGNALIGGTASLDIQFGPGDDVTTILLNPNYGIFVMDNIVAGGILNLGYSKSGDASQTIFGLQPFGRYYMDLGGGPRFFLQAHAGFITSKFNSDFFDSTASGAVFGGGAGLAFFLNEHIAIEGILDFTRMGGDFDSSDLTLGFGVQAYLNKGE